MERKFFFCQFGYGKGLALYGIEEIKGSRVKIWLADHKGKERDGHITVPMLKNVEGEPLPLSVQLTKYKDCTVVQEHTGL